MDRESIHVWTRKGWQDFKRDKEAYGEAAEKAAAEIAFWSPSQTYNRKKT